MGQDIVPDIDDQAAETQQSARCQNRATLLDSVSRQRFPAVLVAAGHYFTDLVKPWSNAKAEAMADLDDFEAELHEWSVEDLNRGADFEPDCEIDVDGPVVEMLAQRILRQLVDRDLGTRETINRIVSYHPKSPHAADVVQEMVDRFLRRVEPPQLALDVLWCLAGIHPETWPERLGELVRNATRRYERRMKHALGRAQEFDIAMNEAAQCRQVDAEQLQVTDATRKFQVGLLGELGPSDLELLDLRHIDEQGLEEMAETLGCSAATVSRRIAKMEADLRLKFETYKRDNL